MTSLNYLNGIKLTTIRCHRYQSNEDIALSLIADTGSVTLCCKGDYSNDLVVKDHNATGKLRFCIQNCMKHSSGYMTPLSVYINGQIYIGNANGRYIVITGSRIADYTFNVSTPNALLCECNLTSERYANIKFHPLDAKVTVEFKEGASLKLKAIILARAIQYAFEKCEARLYLNTVITGPETNESPGEVQDAVQLSRAYQDFLTMGGVPIRSICYDRSSRLEECLLVMTDQVPGIIEVCALTLSYKHRDQQIVAYDKNGAAVMYAKVTLSPLKIVVHRMPTDYQIGTITQTEDRFTFRINSVARNSQYRKLTATFDDEEFRITSSINNAVVAWVRHRHHCVIPILAHSTETVRMVILMFTATLGCAVYSISRYAPNIASPLAEHRRYIGLHSNRLPYNSYISSNQLIHHFTTDCLEDLRIRSAEKSFASVPHTYLNLIYYHIISGDAKKHLIYVCKCFMRVDDYPFVIEVQTPQGMTLFRMSYNMHPEPCSYSVQDAEQKPIGTSRQCNIFDANDTMTHKLEIYSDDQVHTYRDHSHDESGCKDIGRIVLDGNTGEANINLDKSLTWSSKIMILSFAIQEIFRQGTHKNMPIPVLMA